MELKQKAEKHREFAETIIKEINSYSVSEQNEILGMIISGIKDLRSELIEKTQKELAFYKDSYNDILGIGSDANNLLIDKN